MALSPSRNSVRLKQAEIRVMSIECEKVGGINLAQGVCDTEVPLTIRAAARSAIKNGINSYTRYDGLKDLRCAIAHKMAEYNALHVNPETQIVVSAGSTGSFYCACLGLLDAGDEVIVFEPFYGYHINTLVAVGAVPKYVTLERPNWSFSSQALTEAVTPKTKAIIVNTPANPSGKVFTLEELSVIADCACKHDLFVFTDEIYEYFLYDGNQHISPGSLPGMAERTITISGGSKTYSITGWRIGYSVSDPRWAQIIGYINDLIYVCAPSPLQAGVALGMTELASTFYQKLNASFFEKRQQICRALQRAGLPPDVPAGSYYVLADVSRLPGCTSKDKAMYLLKRTGVASVPGEAFFADSRGNNLVRFCFAKSDDELERACRRLESLA